MRHFAFQALTLSLFLFVCPFSVFSDEPLNIIIVIDSSGSMAARMENKTKMDIAKEVLSTDLHFWNIGKSLWRRGLEIKPGQVTTINITVPD